jgi:serine/threonine-protein kinase
LTGLLVGSVLAGFGLVGYLEFLKPQVSPLPAPVIVVAPVDAGLSPPVVAVKTPPTPPPPEVTPSPEVEDPPPVKPPVHKHVAPIELGLPDVQRVVSRERGLVMGCFETHKDELPSANGQVTVQFSILASGKVTGALARGPLAGTPVAHCLEQRVTRMKFPVHKDKEVTLALPFEYRVER